MIRGLKLEVCSWLLVVLPGHAFHVLPKLHMKVTKYLLVMIG